MQTVTGLALPHLPNEEPDFAVDATPYIELVPPTAGGSSTAPSLRMIHEQPWREKLQRTVHSGNHRVAQSKFVFRHDWKLGDMF